MFASRPQGLAWPGTVWTDWARLIVVQVPPFVSVGCAVAARRLAGTRFVSGLQGSKGPAETAPPPKWSLWTTAIPYYGPVPMDRGQHEGPVPFVEHDSIRSMFIIACF
jgi:hypothetical protein